MAIRGRRRFLKQAVAGGAGLVLRRDLPAARAATRARIEVLPDEPIGRILPGLYGHFTEHIGGVVYDGICVGEDSKIPNLGGIRKELVEHMRRLGPSVVRWPGGCFADSYSWRDGVGPRERRPRRPNFWINTPFLKKAPDGPAKYEPNEFGTDEFVTFCRLVGSEPYIAANVRSASPADFVQWVEYCNAPAGSTTPDGTSATAQAGCLIVLDSEGRVAETLSGDPINGPWDMTAFDAGDMAVLFVSNVLNGTVKENGTQVNDGTVARIVLAVSHHGMPTALARTVIGSGFGEITDPNALVIGPTGLGLGPGGTLYVADTLANRIAAIPRAMLRSDSAGTGRMVSEGGALDGPLGLAITPNNDILTVNAGDGNMVETTRGGSQIDVKMVDNTGIDAGTLFGLAVAPRHQGVYFVNDGDNSLRLLH